MREMRDLQEIFTFTVEYKGSVNIDGQAVIRYNDIPYRPDEPYDLYDIDVYFTHPKKYCKDIPLSDIEEILKDWEPEDRENWEKAIKKIKEIAIDTDKFIEYGTITLIDRVAINLSNENLSEEQKRKFDTVIDIPSNSIEEELENIILKEEYDNYYNEYYFILPNDNDNNIVDKIKDIKAKYETLYDLNFNVAKLEKDKIEITKLETDSELHTD